MHWALTTNPHGLEDSLQEIYQNNPRYLRHLNDLIAFLRSRNCQNIREKLNDVSQLDKFRSTSSELEIAKALILRGKSVNLLPDSYAGMISPPDLLVKDQRIEAYVEVKRITEDPVIDRLLNSLRKVLNSYPYKVDLTLNESTSIPTTQWWERDLKEKVVTKALQEFEEKIKMIAPPVPAEIKTNVGIFKIHQSASGRGYFGILTTSAIEIPLDKQMEKIRQDVCEKARKRENWTNDHRTKIYIVALDFEDITYDKDTLEDSLIGDRVTISEEIPSNVADALIRQIFRETPEMRLAKERGWGDFMREVYILPRNRTYSDLNRKGIFFIFTESVTKNVSGVLGKFGGDLRFVPNPFAEINDPQLAKWIN